MGIGLSVAEVLRTRGYECVHLMVKGLERLPDEQILIQARNDNSIIITHDLDFSRLLALSNAPLPSVITFRLGDMRPQSVLDHLFPLIEQFGPDLEIGAAIVVNDRTIRRRRLPIVSPKHIVRYFTQPVSPKSPTATFCHSPTLFAPSAPLCG